MKILQVIYLARSFTELQWTALAPIGEVEDMGRAIHTTDPVLDIIFMVSFRMIGHV